LLAGSKSGERTSVWLDVADHESSDAVMSHVPRYRNRRYGVDGTRLYLSGCYQ
jgi:hypothetical protein